MRRALLAACVLALPGAALAQVYSAGQNGVVGPVVSAKDPDGNARSVVQPTVASALSSVTGSVSGATVTNVSGQVLASAPRRFLSIDNESTTATIACAFGATAALNSAGSFTIGAGQTRTWSTYPVPADAVNCISSAGSSPATIEAN